jgi:hypothetical protein
MQNHHHYEVKKEQIMPCHQCSAVNSSGNTSQLPNIDSDKDKGMNKENDEDENVRTREVKVTNQQRMISNVRKISVGSYSVNPMSGHIMSQ